MNSSKNDRLESLTQTALNIIVILFFCFLLIEPHKLFVELKKTDNIPYFSDLETLFFGIPIRIWACAAISATFLGKFLIKYIIKSKSQLFTLRYFYLLCVFIIAASLGTTFITRSKEAVNVKEDFHGKTLKDKQNELFFYIYPFAVFCKEHADAGSNSGYLVSPYTLDKNIEPYTFQYLLYPEINLIGYKTEPVKNLVLYGVKPPLPLVDSNDIVHKFDDISYLVIKNANTR